ncbi:MAG: four helix bundle protein [Candidatus Omnitrophica bacterium]|nr:four helix bundle protein [Candidatus Omnitrophota bacterium]
MERQNEQVAKEYDLGERTLRLAKRVIKYVNRLTKTLTNMETGKQLVKSATSTGANYIEAENFLSKRDFVMRIKISRKEARETVYWLTLSNPLKGQNLQKFLAQFHRN